MGRNTPQKRRDRDKDSILKPAPKIGPDGCKVCTGSTCKHTEALKRVNEME